MIYSILQPVLVDWESEWGKDLSIRDMCMKAYMERSDGYLVSIVTRGFRWAGSRAELRQNARALMYLLGPEYELWAVNSNFDQEWTEKYVPELIPLGKVWRCVSDFAVYHQLPRNLEDLYFVLFGKKVSKTMRQSMKDVRFTELLAFEQDTVKDYNLTDGVTAAHCLGGLRQLGRMSATEEEVAAHTRMICRRGIAVDEEFIEKARQSLIWLRHNAEKELPWAQREKPLAPQAFNTYCCKQGIAPPANLRKDDEDFSAWMEANPKIAPVLKARQRYEVSNRKLSHIEKFLARVHGGIYYPDLLYCGAPHTRRFSAKGSSDGKQTDSETHSGFNIQNMDRNPLFGDILPDWFSPLPPSKKGKPLPGIFFRNFLVPRPGKRFGVLDFSQIEPRCEHWLVGNDAFLQKIREGFGVYEAFAASSLKWTGAKGTLAETDDNLYRTAKAQVLGLGYGCGKKKFPLVAWKMAGLKITEEEAADIVYQYRDANKPIVDFWGQMEGLIVDSARGDGHLQVTMPNGEIMHQFAVEQYLREFPDGTSKWGFRGQKIRGDNTPRLSLNDIYGAKMVENVTQRMARDLLVEAVINLEKAGIPVVMHAHDEVVFEVDEADAKDAVIEAKRIVVQVPHWAAGLPIGAGGGDFPRYTKA